MYGTDHENSDWDFIGVYMPYREKLLAGEECPSVIRTSTSDQSKKNTGDDVDIVTYSFQEFGRLLAKGDIHAFELLYSGSANRYISDVGLLDTPFELVERRRMYMLNKNLSLFDYVRRQISRYGFSQGRIGKLQTAINTITEISEIKATTMTKELRMSDLGISEYIDEDGFFYFDGAKYDQNSPVSYVLSALKTRLRDCSKMLEDATNGGKSVKWGDIAHAYRVCMNVEVLDDSNGNRMFMNKSSEIETYKKLKAGEVQFSLAMNIIETSYARASNLVEKSYTFMRGKDFDFAGFFRKLCNEFYNDSRVVYPTTTATEKFIVKHTPVVQVEEDLPDEVVTENP